MVHFLKEKMVHFCEEAPSSVVVKTLTYDQCGEKSWFRWHLWKLYVTPVCRPGHRGVFSEYSTIFSTPSPS